MPWDITISKTAVTLEMPIAVIRLLLLLLPLATAIIPFDWARANTADFQHKTPHLSANTHHWVRPEIVSTNGQRKVLPSAKITLDISGQYLWLSPGSALKMASPDLSNTQLIEQVEIWVATDGQAYIKQAWRTDTIASAPQQASLIYENSRLETQLVWIKSVKNSIDITLAQKKTLPPPADHLLFHPIKFTDAEQTPWLMLPDQKRITVTSLSPQASLVLSVEGPAILKLSHTVPFNVADDTHRFNYRLQWQLNDNPAQHWFFLARMDSQTHYVPYRRLSQRLPNIETLWTSKPPASHESAASFVSTDGILSSHWQDAFLEIPAGRHTLRFNADRPLWVSAALTPTNWAIHDNEMLSATAKIRLQQRIHMFNRLQAAWQMAFQGDLGSTRNLSPLIKLIDSFERFDKSAEQPKIDHDVLLTHRLHWGLRVENFSRKITLAAQKHKPPSDHGSYHQHAFYTFSHNLPQSDDRYWPAAPRYIFTPTFFKELASLKPDHYHALTDAATWLLSLPEGQAPNLLMLNIVTPSVTKKCVLNLALIDRQGHSENHQTYLNVHGHSPFVLSPSQAVKKLAVASEKMRASGIKTGTQHTISLPINAQQRQVLLTPGANCTQTFFNAHVTVPRSSTLDATSVSNLLKDRISNPRHILAAHQANENAAQIPLKEKTLMAHFSEAREALNREIWQLAQDLAAPHRSAWDTLRFKAAFTTTQLQQLSNGAVTELSVSDQQIYAIAKKLLAQGDWFMAEQLWTGLYWFSQDPAIITKSFNILWEEYLAKHDYTKLKRLAWMQWLDTQTPADFREFVNALYKSGDYEVQKNLEPFYSAHRTDSSPSPPTQPETVRPTTHATPVEFVYLPTGNTIPFKTASANNPWQATLPPNSTYKLSVRPLHPISTPKHNDATQEELPTRRLQSARHGLIHIGFKNREIHKHFFDNKISATYRPTRSILLQDPEDEPLSDTPPVSAEQKDLTLNQWYLGHENTWQLNTGATSEVIVVRPSAGRLVVDLTKIPTVTAAAMAQGYARYQELTPLLVTNSEERHTIFPKQWHWIMPSELREQILISGMNMATTAHPNSLHPELVNVNPLFNNAALSSNSNDNDGESWISETKLNQRNLLNTWSETMRAQEHFRKSALPTLLSTTLPKAPEPHLNDILRRLTAQWRWQLHTDLIDSSGFKLIKARIPDSPNYATRLGLLPPDTESQLLFGNTPSALQLTYHAPMLLRIMLRQNHYPYKKSQPRDITILYSSGSGSKKITLTDVTAKTVTLPFPSGHHWVKITQRAPNLSTPLSIRYFQRPQSGEVTNWQIIDTPSHKRFHIATAQSPLKVFSPEPTLIRVDTWHDLTNLSHRESVFQNLTGGKIETINLPNKKNGRDVTLYARVFFPEILSNNEIDPQIFVFSSDISDSTRSIDTAISPAPTRSHIDPQLQVSQARPVDSMAFHRGWPRWGSTEAGFSWQTTSSVSQEEADQSNNNLTPQQLSAHLGYRTRLNTDSLFYRTDLRIVDVESQNPTFESNHWFYSAPSKRPYDWTTALSIRAARTNGNWYGLTQLDSELSYRTSTDDDWRFRHSLGLRARGLFNRPETDRYQIDQLPSRVFTDYKADHRMGVYVENQLAHRLYADTEMSAGLSLLSNSNIHPLDLDRARLSFGLFQYYRGLLGGAALTHTHYFSDADRSDSLTRTRLTLNLQHQHRWYRNAWLETRAFAAYETDRQQSEFGISFTLYEDRNSHLYHHDPRSQRFRSLHEAKFFQRTTNADDGLGDD